jgi:hypothetical protein
MPRVATHPSPRHHSHEKEIANQAERAHGRFMHQESAGGGLLLAKGWRA